MGEYWKDPPLQHVPKGFIAVTLKPQGTRLRYQWHLIEGYYWDELLNATLLYIRGRPYPFHIWEMPEDLDALLGGCSPDLAALRATALPVNGDWQHMGRLHARHDRVKRA